MKFGNKLSKLRKEHNLSQEQLADKLEVSRQAVSKWESGQSYPDMDKIIILCKLFNCSIDELINDKEPVGSDKTKRGFTSYVDELLNFITKTVNMFWSMSFKQKISCLFQMGVVVAILVIIFAILGSILASCFHDFYSLLPFRFERFLRSGFETVYIIASLIIGTLITVHIFKIRYLDYFVTVEDSEVKEREIEKPVDMGEKPVYKQTNKEKIVIRDPKHSTFHFFGLLGRLMTIFLKGCSLFASMFFAFSFVFLFFIFGISVWYAKDGIIFVGLLISALGALTINYLILEFLYNFIVNHRQSFKRIFIMGIISLALLGVGFSASFLSYMSFEKISVKEDNDLINTQTRKIIHVTDDDNIVFDCQKTHYCSKIDYEVNENLSDIIMVDILHNDKYNYDLIDVSGYNGDGRIINYYGVYPYNDNYEFFEAYEMVINDLKDKVIRDYSYYPRAEVKVYSSSKNIEKLKNNFETFNK